MRARRGTLIDVDSVEDLDRRLACGVQSLSGWRVRGVEVDAATLEQVDVAGATFVGCRMSSATEQALRAGGAQVHELPADTPVDPFRSELYTAAELYDSLVRGEAYEQSLDARTYAWSRLPETADASMAQALHDHAIDEALTRWLQGRRVVGVMGGHGVVRGSTDYATAAQLGHRLAQTRTVATGGGPGAMEAANLGALLADDAALGVALAQLASAPSFRPVEPWVAAAMAVVRTHGAGRESLGIPTWFYGHEPPNPFATAIAKYFRNAQRESILLQVCNAGIVFLPGAAGTVQEIFQDACENYYADESSLAPMVLVGVEYWTRTLPAWPLLRALAAGRPMADRIHLVDSVEEAAELLG